MGEALERKYFDGQKKVLRQLFNQKQEMLKKRMNYQFQREIAIILSEVKAEYAKKFLDFTDNTEEKYNVSIKKCLFCKTSYVFHIYTKTQHKRFYFYKSLFTTYLIYSQSLCTTFKSS